MINAPSWRGLFLKNILSISGAEIFAFNVSPSAFTKSKFEFLSKTIKAPVLFFLRFSNSGEKVAIVGSTGSGKTTLINLILRFYESNSGNIFIDNKKIESINDVALFITTSKNKNC